MLQIYYYVWPSYQLFEAGKVFYRWTDQSSERQNDLFKNNVS